MYAIRSYYGHSGPELGAGARSVGRAAASADRAAFALVPGRERRLAVPWDVRRRVDGLILDDGSGGPLACAAFPRPVATTCRVRARQCLIAFNKVVPNAAGESAT